MRLSLIALLALVLAAALLPGEGDASAAVARRRGHNNRVGRSHSAASMANALRRHAAVGRKMVARYDNFIVTYGGKRKVAAVGAISKFELGRRRRRRGKIRIP